MPCQQTSIRWHWTNLLLHRWITTVMTEPCFLSPIETANRRVPSFSDLEFLPRGFQSSWGTPQASSSRHGPLFVLKHGDMVTTGAPGTRAPTQVNLPPVAAQWADREDRRWCLENFRMPIAEKVDTSDFYSDIALDFYEQWYFLTIY